MLVRRLQSILLLVMLIAWSCIARGAEDPRVPAEVPDSLSSASDEGPTKQTAEPEIAEPTFVDEYQLLTPSRRRLKETYQIGHSEFRVFRDGRPFEQEEHETVCKMLYRLPSIPAADVEGWAQRGTDWSEIEQDPWRHRGDVFYVQGYVEHVSVVPLIEELVPRFGFDKFYKCRMKLVGSDRIVVILCRYVPKRWPIDQPMREFAAAYGWLLKTGKLRSDRHDIVMAASRIAWHPDQGTSDKQINPGHLLLAKHGMDIGLWDSVKNNRKIRTSERETFYQMLSAASNVPAKVLKKAARAELAERELEKFSIVPLFNEPETQHARVVSLKGTARRATKVVVGQSRDFPGQESDIKARFGMDHYYEVHFFTNDSQDHPLIFVTNRLPTNMPLGEDISAPIRVTGFFFKRYAYKALMPSEDSDERSLKGRLAPLMVGGIVDYLPPPKEPASVFAGVIAGCLFVVALGGIWLGLYFFGAGDQKFQKQTIARAFALDPDQSLDDIIAEPVDPIGPPSE